MVIIMRLLIFYFLRLRFRFRTVFGRMGTFLDRAFKLFCIMSHSVAWLVALCRIGTRAAARCYGVKGLFRWNVTFTVGFDFWIDYLDTSRPGYELLLDPSAYRYRLSLGREPYSLDASLRKRFHHQL